MDSSVPNVCIIVPEVCTYFNLREYKVAAFDGEHLQLSGPGLVDPPHVGIGVAKMGGGKWPKKVRN